MGDDYEVHSLDELRTNEEKPGRRWELSPAFGIDAYNFNVAVLAPGERLSQNAYHYHENQREFFYVTDGRCRVEVEDGSFDLDAGGAVRFDPGVPHLLHNPYDEPCSIVAVGDPPDGRHPVEQVTDYETLLEARADGTPRDD